MSKKQFHGMARNALLDDPSQPQAQETSPVGEAIEPPIVAKPVLEPISKPNAAMEVEQPAPEEPTVRFSQRIDKRVKERLDAVAFYDRKMQKEVLNEAMDLYWRHLGEEHVNLAVQAYREKLARKMR